jgi:hypothetical protein
MSKKRFINNGIYVGKDNPMGKKIEYMFLTYTNEQPGSPGFYYTGTDEHNHIDDNPDSDYVYYLTEMDAIKEKKLTPLTEEEVQNIKDNKIKLFFINGSNYNPKRMFLSEFENKYNVKIKGFLNIATQNE